MCYPATLLGHTFTDSSTYLPYLMAFFLFRLTIVVGTSSGVLNLRCQAGLRSSSSGISRSSTNHTRGPYLAPLFWVDLVSLPPIVVSFDLRTRVRWRLKMLVLGMLFLAV